MNRFRAISLLCCTEHSEQQLKDLAHWMGQFSNNEAAQQELFDWCLQWKLAPWVYTQLTRTKLDAFFTSNVLQQFKTLHTKTEEQNRARNAEAVRFLQLFHEQGIDVAILKGNLFAHTIYHDAGYKRMNDFDILVRQNDWPRIKKIYLSLDCIPMGFGWSGEKEKPTKFSHTAIPFITRNFKCIIGTQWGLKSPTTSYKVNREEMWNTAQPFLFEGVPVKMLSPEYNLLHLILHLGIYKCGIRDCMDIYNLLLTGSINEEVMLRIIRETKAEDKSVFALEMCAACIGELPGKLLGKLKVNSSSFIGKRLKSRLKMFNETGDIQLSYNDYFQDIEKNVLYFNIVPKFHQRLVFYAKILRQIYWPETEMTLRFIDRSHRKSFGAKIKGRWLGPWFSFSMIAQEIGWPVTMLLFLKLFVDLLVSPVNYFTGKESYFDYLKRIGVDPKEMKKTVANVQ